MRIVLVHPNWTPGTSLISFLSKSAASYPPLNLAYLGAIAEAKGHSVKIIDGPIENFSSQEIIKEILAFKPDIAGITASTPYFHLAEEIAGYLKGQDNKITVIIGGAHISVLKDRAFSDVFDYGFIGESEKAWSSFLDKFPETSGFSGIKGIRKRIFAYVPYFRFLAAGAAGLLRPHLIKAMQELVRMYFLPLTAFFALDALQGSDIVLSAGQYMAYIVCDSKLYGPAEVNI